AGRLLAAALATRDIAASEGVLVSVDPLPDDPDVVIDTGALTARLRRAITAAGLALAPKVNVVLDGGGRLHLDALAADVRLKAIGSPRAPRPHGAGGGGAASPPPPALVSPRHVRKAAAPHL